MKVAILSDMFYRRMILTKSLKDAFAARRSHYAIDDKSPLSVAQLTEMVDYALLNVPSAFNSQSTRLVLLTGAQHKKLWSSITMDVLRAIVPAEHFAPTEAKINGFAAGFGTVLFFEDQRVVEGLQQQFPLYADNFPLFSRDTSAMHQYAIWMMLEEAGLGASLQHYSPIIDQRVQDAWDIDPNWKMTAQMPFGGIATRPDPKEKMPADMRRKIIG